MFISLSIIFSLLPTGQRSLKVNNLRTGLLTAVTQFFFFPLNHNLVLDLLV